MAVRFVSYQGASALAGLAWERSPERLSEARLGVRWGKAFAALSDPDQLGAPSLLSALYGCLPAPLKQQTVLTAYSDTASETFFGALLSDGEPVLEPERVFENREALLTWIARESTQNGLQAIVVSQELKGRVTSAIPVHAFGAPAEEYSPLVATGRSHRFTLGSFEAKRSTVFLGALGVFTVGALCLAGWHYFAPQQLALEAKKPAPVTVYTSRDEAAFLRNCAEAFEEAWPMGPGWSRAVSGCTGPGMKDVAGLPASSEPRAFQIYRLRPGWDVTIARKAARVVLDAGQDRVSGTDDTLIVSRAIEGPLVESLTPPTMGQGSQQTAQSVLEGAFLGKARSVRPVGESYEITQWGLIEDMTKTLETLEWLEVASLERRDGLVTAVVRHKQAIAVIKDHANPLSE